MEKQAHNVQLEANEGKAGVHCQLNRTHGREKKNADRIVILPPKLLICLFCRVD